MKKKNKFVTSDLPLTAYLVMKGLTLLTANKGSGGRFEFEIEDPDDRADELKVEYINSDCCKFDNQIRTIKKLLYTK